MFETLKNVFRVKEIETQAVVSDMDDFCHPYRLPDSGTGS